MCENCIQIDFCKKAEERLNHIEIQVAVHSSNIKEIKDDIRDTKESIKEIGNSLKETNQAIRETNNLILDNLKDDKREGSSTLRWQIGLFATAGIALMGFIVNLALFFAKK